MKYSIALLFSLLLFSCSDSQLKAENEELKLELAHAKKTAELEAGSAREAEARALLAMKEAENAMEMAQMADAESRAAVLEAAKQYQRAQKALKDCQGN